MGTPHYIYSTALDESLLDDMGPDEVEDDDALSAPESEDDFDTEVWIHSVDNYASRYIGRVIRSLTDRFLIDRETKKHHLCIHVNAGDVCAERMCGFIAAAFCAAGGRKTRVGLTQRFGFTVETVQSGIWIQSTPSAVGSLFGRFSGGGADAKGIFSAVSKAVVRNSRQYNALADRLGDDFCVWWSLGNGRRRAFAVSASGTVTEIRPYKSMSRFRDGVAMVKNDALDWNLIRPDGTEVCGQWFHNGSQVCLSGEWPIPCEVSDRHEWNFVDRDGSLLLKRNLTGVTAAGYFSDGYAWVKRKERECNFVDMEGRPALRDWGWYLGPVSSGLARVYREERDGGTRVTAANYVRVPQGTLLLGRWYRMATGFSDGAGVVSDMKVWGAHDGKENAVGPDGRLLFRDWFARVSLPSHGILLLRTGKDRLFVADTSGKFLSAHGFRNASVFNGRFVQVCSSANLVRRNMTVMSAATGTAVCDGEIVADYEDAGMICVVRPSGRWSIVAYDGRFVIDEMFGAEFSVPVFRDGFFQTTDGARCIRFGTDGSQVSCV